MRGVVHPDADDGARPGDRCPDTQLRRTIKDGQLSCLQGPASLVEAATREECAVDVPGEGREVVVLVGHDHGAFRAELTQTGDLHSWSLRVDVVRTLTSS